MKLVLTLLLAFGGPVTRPPQKPVKKSLAECVCRCAYNAETGVLWCEWTCG